MPLFYFSPISRSKRARNVSLTPALLLSAAGRSTSTTPASWSGSSVSWCDLDKPTTISYLFSGLSSLPVANRVHFARFVDGSIAVIDIRSSALLKPEPVRSKCVWFVSQNMHQLRKMSKYFIVCGCFSTLPLFSFLFNISISLLHCLFLYIYAPINLYLNLFSSPLSLSLSVSVCFSVY